MDHRLSDALVGEQPLSPHSCEVEYDRDEEEDHHDGDNHPRSGRQLLPRLTGDPRLECFPPTTSQQVDGASADEQRNYSEHLAARTRLRPCREEHAVKLEVGVIRQPIL